MGKTKLDLIDLMSKIVDENTHHYKTDLNYDIENLQSAEIWDTYIWVSRKSGTHCWKLDQVLLDGSGCSEGGLFWLPTKGTKVFLLKIIEASSSAPMGYAHELSPSLLHDFISKNRVRSHVTATMKDGQVFSAPYEPDLFRKWHRFGELKSWEYSPLKDSDLQLALIEFWKSISSKKLVLKEF